jgi:hypothetical protein
MQPLVDHLGAGSHAATPNPESRTLKLRWLHFDEGMNRAIDQKLDSRAPKSRFAGTICASEWQAWQDGSENDAGRGPVLSLFKGPVGPVSRVRRPRMP